MRTNTYRAITGGESATFNTAESAQEWVDQHGAGRVQLDGHIQTVQVSERRTDGAWYVQTAMGWLPAEMKRTRYGLALQGRRRA